MGCQRYYEGLSSHRRLSPCIAVLVGGGQGTCAHSSLQNLLGRVYFQDSIHRSHCGSLWGGQVLGLIICCPVWALCMRSLKPQYMTLTLLPAVTSLCEKWIKLLCPGLANVVSVFLSQYSVLGNPHGRLEDVRGRQHTQQSLCDETQVAGKDHLTRGGQGLPDGHVLLTVNCRWATQDGYS